MPILIDYNQVILASIFMTQGMGTDENSIRHTFLSSLKHNRKKFHGDFGEIVVCTDSKNSWRKGIFPYYKANRKISREESDLDWTELFRIMQMLREELDTVFPYKVLHFDTCEADDIIGTICHTYGTQMNTGSEPYLILSGDKDYIQLHKYANIKQYSPTLKKWVQNSNPEKYLTEQIIKGDTGDGVPNILSPDNCLVIRERQKTMTAGRLAEYSKGPDVMDELTKSRYERNKSMIDLTSVPMHLQEAIIAEYEIPKTTGRSKLFNYFIEKKLKLLLQDIQDF